MTKCKCKCQLPDRCCDTMQRWHIECLTWSLTMTGAHPQMHIPFLRIPCTRTKALNVSHQFICPSNQGKFAISLFLEKNGADRFYWQTRRYGWPNRRHKCTRFVLIVNSSTRLTFELDITTIFAHRCSKMESMVSSRYLPSKKRLGRYWKQLGVHVLNEVGP